MKVITTITVGEKTTESLTPDQLSLIAQGLMIPSQGASKSMARDMLEMIGMDVFGMPLKN